MSLKIEDYIAQEIGENYAAYGNYVLQTWSKIQDKDYDNAIELATKAIEIYPNKSRAYELRALAYVNAAIGEPEDIRMEYCEKAEADLMRSAEHYEPYEPVN